MPRLALALVGLACGFVAKYCVMRMLDKEIVRAIDKKVAESHTPSN